ncbi:serine protease [Dehalococcoides mccartyi]|jgi:Trypsin-like serine proteases, typically periplasmic, contain C-terminal PDZ domain|uniref:S1C family serine protease n=1 Tax=Dehalococcoides mccartyi TaxID=61435 RepID=UPI00099BC611|nr:trypsin-like peptidase domain-containing protein [Dehalococcoides mccartyi]AQX74756.1 serine protease [Dehalococcoides mccartyi]AQY73333.1 serine protease [Dehalococcoides mccartyi]
MKKKLHLFSLFLCILIATAAFSAGGCDYLSQPINTDNSDHTPNTSTPLDENWKFPSPQQNLPELANYALVVARVKPAVVAVDVEYITQDIFGRQTVAIASGSGFIIDPSGYIITNNHVVEGGSTVTVTLSDNRTFTASRVVTDSRTDLAVIKVDTLGEELPFVYIGDSSALEVGEPVAAIGNALGLGITMKGGWISRLDAQITVDQSVTLYGLIGTDAAINEGNSGGPLVNMAGEVIGITSAKIVEVGVEGVGYAININSARTFIEELVNKGYITRPFMGVIGILTVDAAIQSYFKLGIDKGVLLRGIAENGPAEKAGLKANDVILSINGQAVLTDEELILAIHGKKVGDKIEVSYFRDGVTSTVTLILAETPPPES